MRAFENRFFRLEPVRPGLWLLVEKTVRALVRANVWVIEGEDAVLVIDGGWGLVDWPLAEIFASVDRPLWFFTTHAHCDHIAQAFQFTARRFGHALSDAVMRDPGPENTNAQPWTPYLQILAEGFDDLGFVPEDYGAAFRAAPLTDLLGQGDSIDLGGRRLAVHETPGHSWHSLTLFEAEQGWLFPGDVMIATYIVDILPDSDKTEVLRTHQRLHELPFQWSFGGHGAPLDRRKAEGIIGRYAERKAEEGLRA